MQPAGLVQLVKSNLVLAPRPKMKIILHCASRRRVAEHTDAQQRRGFKLKVCYERFDSQLR